MCVSLLSFSLLWPWTERRPSLSQRREVTLSASRRQWETLSFRIRWPWRFMVNPIYTFVLYFCCKPCHCKLSGRFIISNPPHVTRYMIKKTGPPIYGALRLDWLKGAGLPENSFSLLQREEQTKHSTTVNILRIQSSSALYIHMNISLTVTLNSLGI